MSDLLKLQKELNLETSGEELAGSPLFKWPAETLAFGKYKGKTIMETICVDPEYVNYLLEKRIIRLSSTLTVELADSLEELSEHFDEASREDIY